LATVHDYTAAQAPLTVADWQEAKEATQQTLILTPELAEQLQAQLENSATARGRALRANVAGLRTGDRLEEIEGSFDTTCDLRTLPPGTRIHFFKHNPDSRLTHWAPMFFCRRFGEPILEPGRIVGDLLHTVDGGVCQYAAGAIFSLLVKHAAPVLGVARHRLRRVTEQRALERLRVRLRDFYLTEEGAHTEHMSHVTLRTFIGSDLASPVVDAKAMQSRGLFLFSHWLLARTVDHFRPLPQEAYDQAKGLLKSAECLRDWLAAIRACGPVMPLAECSRCETLAVKHVVLWRAHTGAAPKPKHHAFVEMSRALRTTGNPAHYSTYLDESINAMVARLARSVHPANFSLEVLKKYVLRRTLDARAY
jgi:hypothetical protein